MRTVRFVQSRVVTWWHGATLGRRRRAAPTCRSTAVEPRLACASDVEVGTMMTERHKAVRLNPSCDTTTTGRRRRCSDQRRRHVLPAAVERLGRREVAVAHRLLVHATYHAGALRRSEERRVGE